MCSEHQLMDLMTILAIPAGMLHGTWQELECRLDVLRATKGAHIEIKKLTDFHYDP
jgi:hypothetical protein